MRRSRAGIRCAADHGADVINLSFEFDDGDVDGAARSRTSCAALRYARRHGVARGRRRPATRPRAAVAYPARSDT